MEHDKILEKVTLLKPDKVLGVGCGCGGFTTQLSPHCGEITAIDSSQALIDRCKRENSRPNISYLCMDGRNIRYPDNSYDLVAERSTLHHILEWEKTLDEMIRVSSKYVLVEEPIDDPRNEEKRNAIRAQELNLELQNEVGYSHYKFLTPDSLGRHFQERRISVETEIVRSDEPKDFDEFFSSFNDFAGRSDRKEYWLERLDGLRRRLKGKKLCKSDHAFVVAVK